jgi:hypothetical protein
LRERQEELSLALQKEALERARARLLPKLRIDAEKELIEERRKLRK